LLLGLGKLQEIANALHRIARHEIQVRRGQSIGRRRLLKVVSGGLWQVAAMGRCRVKSMQNPAFRIRRLLEFSVAEAIGRGGRSIA
jgi:hypothetical protein